MKIRRKHPVIEFNPVFTDCDTAQTYEVSQGTQRLGHVSYEQAGGCIFVTDLFVDPEFSAFGVETQILDALLSSEEVHSVSLVVPLSAASYYEGAGFECDSKQILLTKHKS
jgi:hypothetical protein